MKNTITKLFLFLLAFFILSTNNKVLSTEPTTLDFFYSTTCPHCAKAKIFLNQLKKDYPSISINQYEISQNNKRLIELYQKYRVPDQAQGLVPVIFTGKNYFVGFNEETSRQIKKYILDVDYENGFDPRRFALPVTAILFGAMDGFNVCSLGALLIILALVLTLKSRTKVLVFGGIFILTTAVIYGFLIFFWYQLFSILSPYLRQMELVIGILTIGGSIYFLKEFIKFKKQGPACEMGTAQKIEGSFQKKFKELIDNKAQTLAVIIAILLFAATITIVEFPCSAAVPVAFASILSRSQLTNWLYVFYIVLYVVFYMLDEILVFLIAFFSMKLWLTSPKIMVWITLAESVVLFFLGVYYLFGLF